ncbi:hypothetical protein POTOM_024753 [Populus tomentosa]|uniref:Uncharacterized protein n=1 Tax=Populus tomentosa TaxID=118781 RepID=A0A8X7ZJV4_POPTO|nr:hypothetical protein POTOM_024753 [Populus tomentosa]
MAGLQYNFFPTDFFYPRPQTVKVDTAAAATQKSAALPLQIQEREVMITGDLKPKHHPASLVLHNNKHGSKIEIWVLSMYNRRKEHSPVFLALSSLFLDICIL